MSSVILIVTLCTTVFLPYSSFAVELPEDAYVYVLEVNGKVTYQAIGGKKEVQMMEIVHPGTILEIEKDASILLAVCGSKKALHLSHKDSPYTIKMDNFKKGPFNMRKLAGYLKAAIIHFVYPHSRLGPQVQIVSRGVAEVQCEGLWPPDEAKIMPIEWPITFKWGWGTDGSHFLLRIEEQEDPKSSPAGLGKRCIGYFSTSQRQVDVPAQEFEPGTRYRWSVEEMETGRICWAVFELLPKSTSENVIEILSNISSLVPVETDGEVICRLQAGYLRSKGLIFDALRWMEHNGVKQEY